MFAVHIIRQFGLEEVLFWHGRRLPAAADDRSSISLPSGLCGYPITHWRAQRRYSDFALTEGGGDARLKAAAFSPFLMRIPVGNRPIHQPLRHPAKL
ncbi:hypothetical protein KCP75_06125 [Salmonella enterica subsp. enterica]|nr:hypothetical protein KCP75_06125 [Salmonella enterica subsp. enterica]